jgi:hypothetical protein
MIEPLIHLAGFDFVPQNADQIELCLRTTNGSDPSTRGVYPDAVGACSGCRDKPACVLPEKQLRDRSG